MISFAIYAMVYLGSALMLYNIYGFIRYARSLRGQKNWEKHNKVLYIPIILLIFFLAGYLAIGIFGKPDIIVSGILFGGSIFVFVIYKLMTLITKRIIEGEHLRAELMAAEESSRAKSDFLSSMSHEMRTPLNVIIGLDSLALGEKDLSPDTRHRLEKIGDSAKYLLGIINNILELNNSETEKLEPKKEQFSLCAAIRQVNAIIGTLCADKGLTYSFTVPDRGECIYIGDELMIKQVLLTLLDNAVKYTDAPGRVELSIDCSPSEGDIRYLQFRVSDTGEGIDSDFLPHVFDAFSREDASATSSGGSGLGLAVAKSYIEHMGGTISVESEKNKGSVFTIILSMPFVAGADEDPPKQDAEEVTLENKHILIVEDIPENAEIVSDLLEIEDALPEHAENGKIAVDMFSRSPLDYYDAVLMDLRMPVMDGLTATRTIRALDRADAATVPIIALSANAFEKDIQQSLEAGMNAHLAKPADADMLYSTIKKYISMTRR